MFSFFRHSKTGGLLGQASAERERFASYLLGRLPPEEAEAIAERLFAEEAFLAEMEDVERDLLDAYATGALSVAERPEVDTHLLTSEDQREKLRYARALCRRRGRHPVPVWKWAAAAAVVLTAGTGALWIARLQNENQRLETALAVARKRPPLSPAGAGASFLLSPVNRGGGADLVRLEGDTPLIRFSLATEDPAGTPANLRLTTAEGLPVLELGHVPAEDIGGSAYWFVWIPGGILPDGAYAISASEQDGRQITYSIRVTRQK